jgi:hypothetical protein
MSARTANRLECLCDGFLTGFVCRPLRAGSRKSAQSMLGMHHSYLNLRAYEVRGRSCAPLITSTSLRFRLSVFCAKWRRSTVTGMCKARASASSHTRTWSGDSRAFGDGVPVTPDMLLYMLLWVALSAPWGASSIAAHVIF